MRLILMMLVLCAAPLSAQGTARWEYGVLVMIGGMMPLWIAATPDSTIAPSVADGAFDERRALAYVKEPVGTGSKTAAGLALYQWKVLALLNAAGAQGWELMTVGGESYLFKRRRS
jgi:hypothetical protein